MAVTFHDSSILPSSFWSSEGSCGVAGMVAKRVEFWFSSVLFALLESSSLLLSSSEKLCASFWVALTSCEENHFCNPFSSLFALGSVVEMFSISSFETYLSCQKSNKQTQQQQQVAKNCLDKSIAVLLCAASLINPRMQECRFCDVHGKTLQKVENKTCIFRMRGWKRMSHRPFPDINLSMDGQAALISAFVLCYRQPDSLPKGERAKRVTEDREEKSYLFRKISLPENVTRFVVADFWRLIVYMEAITPTWKGFLSYVITSFLPV